MSDPAPNPTLADLMQVSTTARPDVFHGATESYGPLGIYGGHFLGQALSAALATVDQPKLAHSFHAYFLRRGDPNEPRIDYHVTRLREGKGSEVRSVAARQKGQDVFHMMASFKRPEDGDVHQLDAPEVLDADALVAAREARGEGIFPFPIVQGGRAQIEFATRSFREFDAEQPPELRTWMRIPPGETLDDRKRQSVLAFLSDGTLMFNSVLPHGVPFSTHRLTSLDQSVWFHSVPDPADWMLFDQRSTAAADGRGMNHGEIFSSDGLLCMSCSQESMLRRLDPPA